MLQLFVVIVGLVVSLCGLMLTADAVNAQYNLLIAAVTALAISAGAVLDNRRVRQKTTSKSAISSKTAKWLAIAWLWGASALFLLYFFILRWHEWWHFTLGFLGVGLLCLGFSVMLARDVSAGKEDEVLAKFGRTLTLVQLGGMVIAMIGMVIDRKMPRDTANVDWAANHIFFFGALAIALISFNALVAGRHAKVEKINVNKS